MLGGGKMKCADFSYYLSISTWLDVVANIGKYATLLGGIASVVGEDPNLGAAFLACVGYVFSGYIGDVARRVERSISLDVSLRDTERKLRGIERKLEDIGVGGEKNGSKRICT